MGIEDELWELLGHDFRINIELGNDAMSTPEDVAGALEKVAARLRNGEVSGVVMDDNGARVGDFEFD